MRLHRAAPLLSALALLLAGCGAAADDADPSGTTGATSESFSAQTGEPATEAPATSEPTTQPAPTEPPPPPPLAGKTVVIDPGHNGLNSAHPEIVNKPVPDGRGGTKACNTSGTTAAGGYAEHEMNWSIALTIRDLLTAQGATVVLTRPDDNGVGPCVDERAAVANDNVADAMVSIHGDGAGAASNGFYCILTPLDPGGPDVAAQSLALAEHVRDGILATGIMPVANYAGSNGIDPSRPDLAGLNHSTRPSTLCELGNMKSPTDAAVQTSESGRLALATGIANGIAGYLAQ